MTWNSGFETTADIHTVPSHAVRRGYGAVTVSSTPPATVVDEVVTDDSDEQHDDAESKTAVAVDDRLQIFDASIQHGTNEVLVTVDMPTPDQTAV